MKSDIFRQWLERQSHQVVSNPIGDWYTAGPRILQSFPYHSCIRPDEKHLRQLLLTGRFAALRYSTDINQPVGCASYHVIYDRPCMEFSSLAKKVRHDVKHGLEYASIEPISLSHLAVDGWLLRLETLQRQGRIGAENEMWWQKLCLSADGLEGFEAWGAVHEGKLVSSLLAFFSEDCCSILYQQSGTDHLKHGVNNALAFVITNEALSRPGIQKVFYGLHSLDAPSSVDEFKFRMGYHAHPVRQRVVFNPLLAPLFNPASYRLVQRLQKASPGSPLLAKAEGMVRFYLEGQKPLQDQQWPEHLLDQKDRLLLTA